MACFRRTISLSSLVSRYSRVSSLIRLPTSPSPLPATIDNAASSSSCPSHIRSRSFQSTSGLFSASRSFNNNQDDVIDEDTILFEGCDYKHWLITMDFPKDPKPSPEEMVETYVQTLAKVVGSVEEAKRRMYACSTTTYNGFQAEMDEETANKFEGMPGVVFVLPDSYIDPVNKEYGGDKYINGTIIPRPPPVQYGRQRRNRDQPQRGQMQNQRWGPTYDQQGSMQADARNYAPQQGPPHQQNYNPQQGFQPQQNFPPQQQYGGPQNYSSPQNHGQFQKHPSPQNHGHFQNNPSPQNYSHPQNYPSQQNYGPPRQEQRPNPRSTYNRDFPASGRDAYQEAPYQGSNNQGDNFSLEQRGYPMGNQSNYTLNQRDGAENNQTYTPPSPARGSYEQGIRGSFGHNQVGPYGPRPGEGGNYGPGPNYGYGHDNSGQRDQRSFQPTEPVGLDQGRR